MVPHDPSQALPALCLLYRHDALPTSAQVALLLLGFSLVDFQPNLPLYLQKKVVMGLPILDTSGFLERPSV